MRLMLATLVSKAHAGSATVLVDERDAGGPDCVCVEFQAADFSVRNWVRFARFLVFVFEPQVANFDEAS